MIELRGARNQVTLVKDEFSVAANSTVLVMNASGDHITFLWHGSFTVWLLQYWWG